MSEYDKLLIDIERLKLQVEHLESTVDSEKGTRKRTTAFLMEELSRIEKAVRELMSGDENSLSIKIDRLIQESNRRQKLQAIVISQGIALGLIIVKLFVDWAMKRG